MSAAAREALWAREKRERWIAPFLRVMAKAGYWAVVRINDDGRREMVRGELSAEAAESMAGAMRDLCPDEDVADGWNYLPRKQQHGTPMRRYANGVL